MTDQILDLAWRLGHWTYALIFVMATLEASAFLGLVVPGETMTIAAGFMASAGGLELTPTIAAAALGAMLGDSIGYEMGRRLGRPWLARHGERFGFHGHRLGQIDSLFARHGGKTIVLARFVGFLRALAPFVAGAARMPYWLCPRRFLVGRRTLDRASGTDRRRPPTRRGMALASVGPSRGRLTAPPAPTRPAQSVRPTCPARARRSDQADRRRRSSRARAARP